VLLGFVLLAADVEGGGQVAAEACLGAGEAIIHGCERGVKVVGGLRVAEGDQAVAAPAGQVGLVERQIREVFPRRAVSDFLGGVVESFSADWFLSGCGGHLGFGGAEPAADLVWDGGVGLVVGGADHGERFGWAVQVQKYVGLLPRGECQQARVACFAGGGGGALEVGPGAGQAAHVDGLPSGQSRGVREGPGELLPIAGAKGVSQAGLDVADVSFQLARDSRGAEAAVQEPDVVGLALEHADAGAVDAAGRGDLPEQFGVLPELAGAALREDELAVSWRGDKPSRIRAWSGMSRPSAMRWKTWTSRILRMSLMTSLTRPCPMSAAVPMRIWLIPVYWQISRNSAPMSRLRRAWQTSARSQKAAGIDGGSNALARMAASGMPGPCHLCDRVRSAAYADGHHLTVRTPCVMGS